MRAAQGTVIADRYELVRPLGAGAMGELWAARDRRLESACAIKLLRAERILYAEARERFALEAKAAAQLRSPHVVQIFDQGDYLDLPYIAMELLEGEDLAARLARVGRLDPGTTYAFVADIGKALTRAHAAGLVHRDLKPANIFVARDSDGETVKVLDFGIAKNLFRPGPANGPASVAVTAIASATATRAGALLGTPFYMSPEQIDGAANVDTRTDLWSLGVLTFECLTGRPPFEADDVVRLLVRIQEGPPPMPSSLVPELPRAVDAWFARACAHDPNLRFQTAREMTDALALALGREVPDTHPADGPNPAIGEPPRPADAMRSSSQSFAYAATYAVPRQDRQPREEVDVSAPTVRAGAPPRKAWAPWAVGAACLGLVGGAVPLGVHFYGTPTADAARAKRKVVTPDAPTSAGPASTGPRCNTTHRCPDPMHEVCSLDGAPDWRCIPSHVGAEVQVAYEDMPDRWNGVARGGYGQIEPNDFGRAIYFFGDHSKYSILHVIFRHRVQTGRFPVTPGGDPAFVIQLDEGEYPKDPAHHGSFTLKSGSIEITSVDYTYGGHVDGSLEAELAGGTGPTPIHATVKARFHADFPTPGADTK